jgi:hypothetical protein
VTKAIQEQHERDEELKSVREDLVAKEQHILVLTSQHKSQLDCVNHLLTVTEADKELLAKEKDQVADMLRGVKEDLDQKAKEL